MAKFEHFMTLIAFIYPFSSLPQIIDIYTKKSAENVSLLTWVLYFLFLIPFLKYSILRKDKPLIIMYSMWSIVYIVIIAGILIY